MADLPEDGGWVEGVRAIEETDPVRFDIYNQSLQALASRTKYLQENMGQGSAGGGATFSSVETRTTSTLALSRPDIGKFLLVDSNTTVVIPVEHGFNIGEEIHFLANYSDPMGNPIRFQSQLTPLVSTEEFPALGQPYAVATLKYIGNSFVIFGNLIDSPPPV